MHVLENSYVLLVNGEKIGHSLENFLQMKKKFPRSAVVVFLHYVPASCPSAGCDLREFSEGFFTEFIRNYLDCPHAD